MEIISPGIVVFKNVFLRSEEVIDLAEQSSWRPGTAGADVNPKVRITDIHELDPETELHAEILQTFVDNMNDYVTEYKGCKISQGESLRIARYKEGGHYSVHSDTSGAERVLSGVLYLNNDFTGGELNFPQQDITLNPEEGMLVLFPSNFMYLHQSLPITKGIKYCALGWFR